MHPISPKLQYTLASAEDRTWFVGLWTSNIVMRLIPGGAQSKEKAAVNADKMLGTRFPAGFGYWVVKKNGQPVGYVVLRDFGWDDRFKGIELGYIVDEKHWGQGIASEAVPAVTQHAIENCKCESLLAFVNHTNKASEKIVQKLGFKKLPEVPARFPENAIWKWER